MHTLIVIGSGIILLGLFVTGTYFLSANDANDIARAALYFIPVWFAIAVVNMAFGVIKAGYGVMDELPFLLINFSAPAIIAVAIWWKLHA